MTRRWSRNILATACALPVLSSAAPAFAEAAAGAAAAGGAVADSLEMDYARRLAAKNVEVEHGRGQWEYYGDLETFTVSLSCSMQMHASFISPLLLSFN